MSNLWELEEDGWRRGYRFICGVDEAGAGPLAGPLYAAAVILPRYIELKWLNDSKKVTPRRRDILYEEIMAQALAASVVSVEEAVIDEINILNARMLAMERAVVGLNPPSDYALIDGNYDKGISFPHEVAVGGDARSASIAAASILAKVSRDRYMEEMAEKYPEYGFERHKGYPTKLHYAMLDRYGPCPIHRKTFLKKWEAGR